MGDGTEELDAMEERERERERAKEAFPYTASNWIVVLPCGAILLGGI
jgi:hypothetical protein